MTEGYKSQMTIPKKKAESEAFGIDKVTPEMAAVIVKRFILPMFDKSKRIGPNKEQMGSV